MVFIKDKILDKIIVHQDISKLEEKLKNIKDVENKQGIIDKIVDISVKSQVICA